MDQNFNMKKIFIAFLATFTILSIQAQIGVKDYQRAEQFMSVNIAKKYYRSWVKPNWTDDHKSLWYSINTKKGTEYILFNIKSKKKKALFNQEELAKLLSAKQNDKVEAYDLPIKDLGFNKAKKFIKFRIKKDWFKFFTETNKLEAFKPDKPNYKHYRTSPDKSKIAFVKDYNIWIKDKETGNEIQITKDGNQGYGYGVSPSWYATRNIESSNDFKLEANINWSPDNRYIISGKYDRRQARKLYLYRSLPEKGHRAEVYEYERPIAGDSIVPTIEFILVDTKLNTYKKLQLKPLATFLPYGFKWKKDGSKAYQVRYQRGYQSVNVVEVTASNAEVKTVIQESSKTYVDPLNHDLVISNNNNEVIWLSERDGWNHAYRYNTDSGVVINQITKGTFVIRDIIYNDEKNEKLYFTAGGRECCYDPYYPLLYVINHDGTDMKTLSPEKAHHEFFISKDKKYIVDNFSMVQEPNTAILRRLKDGKIIAELEQGDITEILAMGWQKPEPFKVKARDGKTDIYGVLFKPNNFDPEKSYPIINGTYSGPQTIRTPKNFKRGLSNDDTPLAQLGFVLVNIDGMGTAFRSKAFHDVSYRNLGDIGAPDHIAAIKQLAKDRPWMDINRVGIFGHSAGGYDAAHAILTHPEFYKVAVATAGNHDHRSAKAWWPELYMGYPAGKNYDEQSNYNLAKNLKGNLLLVHGDLDQNVNPTASMRLAAELIKANKDFELILIPNKDHSQVYYDKYLIRKRWDFFVKHLHGTTPPKEYKIK